MFTVKEKETSRLSTHQYNFNYNLLPTELVKLKFRQNFKTLSVLAAVYMCVCLCAYM
jgi:hypothetical protein